MKRAHSNARKRPRRLRLIFVLFLMVAIPVIAGCGTGDDASEDEVQVAPEAQSDVDAAAQAPEGVDATPVVVRLTNYEIDMPQEIPAGVIDFEVNNYGTEEHSFVLEGEGIDARLESEIPPGDTMMLRAQLEPGAYRALCPVENHPERGMITNFTVVPATPGSPAAPTGTPDEATDAE